MANFNTHINTAAFVSGIGSAILVSEHIIPKSDMLLYFFAGMIGGVLPDLDHDTAKPLKMVYFFIANILSLFLIFNYINQVRIGNLLLIWLSGYLITFLLFFLFKKLTTHRGMFHSIPAAFISFFITILISYNIFHFSIQKSYFLGFFVFIGYITHLILDEIFSIDIVGNHIKSSFGSALKLYSKNRWSILTYLILIGLFVLLPHKEYLIKIYKVGINVF